MIQTKQFSIDKDSHLALRKATRDMKEHGGFFAADLRTGKLVLAKEQTGAYNKIDMARGVVDTHTHPARCLNDDTCAVGIPSPSDITNICTGSMYGSYGHCVYSREGTYFIQVPQPLVQKFTCDYKMFKEFNTKITKASDQLHEYFMKRKFPYKTYTKEWVKLMRGFGLNIKFFELNKIPRFVLPIDAAVYGNQQVISKEITVPTNLEGDLPKVCKRKYGK